MNGEGFMQKRPMFCYHFVLQAFGCDGFFRWVWMEGGFPEVSEVRCLQPSICWQHKATLRTLRPQSSSGALIQLKFKAFFTHPPSGLAQDRLAINTQMCDNRPWTDTETHSLHPLPCRWCSNTWFLLRTENCKMNSSPSHHVVIQVFVHYLLWWYGKSPTWDSLCYSSPILIVSSETQMEEKNQTCNLVVKHHFVIKSSLGSFLKKDYYICGQMRFDIKYKYAYTQRVSFTEKLHPYWVPWVTEGFVATQSSLQLLSPLAKNIFCLCLFSLCFVSWDFSFAALHHFYHRCKRWNLGSEKVSNDLFVLFST